MKSSIRVDLFFRCASSQAAMNPPTMVMDAVTAP